MSITSEITRLQNAKANIKVSIEAKGVTVGEGTIDTYSSKIDAIQKGIIPTGTINITENGTHNVTNYASANVNIPKEMPEADFNEVNFYDIDGKRLYSYTVAEVQALTSLPPIPEKEGLRNGTWNWTLEDLKSENAEADVGLNYDTIDGNTRLYISIPEDYADYKISICGYKSSSGTCIIDWGDGTTSNFNSTSQTILNHTYTNSGNYVIVIKCTNATFFAASSVSYNLIDLCDENYSIKYKSSYIKKINVGSSMILNRGSFKNLTNCEIITIPATQGTSAPSNYFSFENCYYLREVTLPRGMTILTNNIFYGLSHAKGISLPKTLINNFVNSNLCFNCNSLPRLLFPVNSKLNSSSNMFYQCFSMKEIRIPSLIKSLQSNFCLSAFSLQKINLEGITGDIAAGMFQGCKSLRNITKINCNTLGGRAFMACSINGKLKLNCTKIGSANTYSGGMVFNSCTALEKIWISNKCTSINGTGSTSTSYMPFVNCSKNLKLYLEAEEAPSTFGTHWNYVNSSTALTVAYGVSEEEFDAL